MKPVLGLLLTSAMAVITTTIHHHGRTTAYAPKLHRSVGSRDGAAGLSSWCHTKQAAFSHHGKAIRTVILPNGKEGWVYEVGIKDARTYQHPTKEKHTVHETEPSYGVRTYTLEFDSKGVVIDVLYNEQGRHDGLTALQVQRRIRGEMPGKH